MWLHDREDSNTFYVFLKRLKSFKSVKTRFQKKLLQKNMFSLIGSVTCKGTWPSTPGSLCFETWSPEADWRITSSFFGICFSHTNNAEGDYLSFSKLTGRRNSEEIPKSLTLTFAPHAYIPSGVRLWGVQCTSPRSFRFVSLCWKHAACLRDVKIQPTKILLSLFPNR